MIDPAAAPTRPNPEDPILQVRYRDLDHGVCAVALDGEIDLATAPTLKSALGQLPEGAHRVIVDLSDVRHMDSTGLGVLVGFRRRLPNEELIVIAAPRINVRAVFELTGLDFRIFDTVEDAVAHFARADAQDRQPGLSADSAMVIGLASTALPFADTPVAEAERWLRVLRLHGEAGQALTALGLSEGPLQDAGAPPATEAEPAASGAAAGRDPIAAVVEHARRAAVARGASTVGTADLLRGVMAVYGAAFDWVLRARGSDPADVLVQLGETSALSAA